MQSECPCNAKQRKCEQLQQDSANKDYKLTHTQPSKLKINGLTKEVPE